MTRQAKLLAVLGTALVVVLFWLLLWKPQSDELTQVRDAIAATQDQQAAAQQTIQRLKDVRARAPEIEADLVAAESIVPTSASLPATLRQFQLAADDAGASLVSVTPGRPTAVVGDTRGLAELSLAVQVEGSYFQIVDVLRRLEDPSITARGIVWDLMDVAVEEYPTLTLTLSGRMFAVLDDLAGAQAADAATTDDPAAGDAEGEGGDAGEDTTSDDAATDNAEESAA